MASPPRPIPEAVARWLEDNNLRVEEVDARRMREGVSAARAEVGLLQGLMEELSLVFSEMTEGVASANAKRRRRLEEWLEEKERFAPISRAQQRIIDRVQIELQAENEALVSAMLESVISEVQADVESETVSTDSLEAFADDLAADEASEAADESDSATTGEGEAGDGEGASDGGDGSDGGSDGGAGE